MRGLDRRRLLTSGAAAAVFALSGGVAGAGPKQQGHLRVAVENGSFTEIGGVFETLTEIAADGSLQGELAQNWHSLDGGKSWVFELRPGIRFHDGREFTSKDAVHSLRHHIRSSGQGSILGKIDRVRQSGPGAIRLDLAVAEPALPVHLADPDLVIFPAKGSGAGANDAIGTGPYRVDSASMSDLLLLRHVGPHWRDQKVAWFDTVEIHRVASHRDALHLLVEDRVDLVENIEYYEADILKRMKDIRVEPSANGKSFAYRTGLQHGPMIGQQRPYDDGRLAERWWRA